MKEYIEILKSGKLLAIPTETVYGLAADATHASAVSEIYRLKNRPDFNPLIIHCHSIEQIEQYALLSPKAYILAKKFWPGSLSLVLPLKNNHGLSSAVTAGLETVAVRIPNHPLTLKLLKEFNKPLAAPSANISGKVSPTLPDHVRQSFGNQCPPILEGGRCHIGLESTIIGFDIHDMPVILRHGGIPIESIEYVIGTVKSHDLSVINAPGQLKSHYAPKAQLILDSTTPTNQDGFLAFGTNMPQSAKFIYQLSKNEDLFEAASHLYDGLHTLDRQNINNIHVAPLPKNSIGRAIYDRLTRAAYKEI